MTAPVHPREWSIGAFTVEYEQVDETTWKVFANMGHRAVVSGRVWSETPLSDFATAFSAHDWVAELSDGRCSVTRRGLARYEAVKAALEAGEPLWDPSHRAAVERAERLARERDAEIKAKNSDADHDDAHDLTGWDE